MHFKAFIASVLLASTASAALSADDAVTNIEKLNKELKATQDKAKEIQSTVDAFTKVSDLLNKYREVIATEGDLSTALNQEDKYNQTEQTTLCDSFKTSEEDRHDLLVSLTGKAQLFEATPFKSPIAATLRTDEGGHDVLAGIITDKTPSCQKAFEKAKGTVEEDFDKAIKAYE